MSAGAREGLVKARAIADTAYEEWVDKVSIEEVAWQDVGYGKSGGSKLDPSKIVGLVQANWGKIATTAVAFGIPLGIADTGAFTGALGVLSNFWPF